MRRNVIRLILVASLMTALVDSAVAQVQPAAGAPTNVVKVQRPYYVEGAVVLLLIAASVFARLPIQSSDLICLRRTSWHEDMGMPTKAGAMTNSRSNLRNRAFIKIHSCMPMIEAVA